MIKSLKQKNRIQACYTPTRNNRENLESEADKNALRPVHSLNSPVHPYDSHADSQDRSEYVSGVGKPLKALDRLYYEKRFGMDFSSVRIHEDSAAEKTAEDIHARAFTYNNHIGFGRKDSSDDPQLLDHEMTHAAQQAQPGSGSGLMRDDDEDVPGIGRTPPSGDYTVAEGTGPEDDFILFNRDSAVLDAQDRTTIQALVGQYSQAVTVHLHGYTSREGTDEYNTNLSAHRALAVREFIEPLLPQGSQVVAFAHGETTDFGRRYRDNRRVGIDIIERMQTRTEETPSPSESEPETESPESSVTLDPSQLFPCWRSSLIFPDLELRLNDPAFYTPSQLPGSTFPYLHGAAAEFANRGVPYSQRDAASFEDYYESWRDRYILWGLSPERAAWLANLGTDTAASIQITVEYPTDQELLDRQMGTTPTIIPVFTDGMMRWLWEQME